MYLAMMESVQSLNDDNEEAFSDSIDHFRSAEH